MKSGLETYRAKACILDFPDGGRVKVADWLALYSVWATFLSLVNNENLNSIGSLIEPKSRTLASTELRFRVAGNWKCGWLSEPEKFTSFLAERPRKSEIAVEAAG